MKKRIFIIIFLIIVVVGLLSLYNTFAFNKGNDNVDESFSDINLTYSLKDIKTMNISVSNNEEKYIDMNLRNIYNENVKYGVYYKMKEPKSVPDGLNVSVDENSKSGREEILKSNEEKTITIKIVNNSSYNVSLTLGSVVGFVQGDINNLLSDDMFLIN